MNSLQVSRQVRLAGRSVLADPKLLMPIIVADSQESGIRLHDVMR